MSRAGVSTRTRAVLFLVFLALVGLLATRAGSRATPVRSSVSDVDTYHAIIRNVRAGMPYYDAVGNELRRWGYATREVFNWRTPLLMSAEARATDRTSQRMLLFLTALLCAGSLTMSTGWIGRALPFVMQLGMLGLFSGSDIYVMSEPWAGVLIALSICAYRWHQRTAAIGLGLLALFVRELAAPYCVVCTVLAASRRQWREVGAWIAGAALYAGYYAWHLSHVLAHRLPTDISHTSSWLGVRGIASVVTKVHWQGWLVLLPMWVTAMALVVIISGVSSNRTDARTRATSAAYLGFFFVAGQPFDWYWGLVAWPCWALLSGDGITTIINAVRTTLRR